MRGWNLKSGQRGFTLIELLIVVVIIGILAAIAIPKFAATKEKAYISKMKADLRNLATAQESYVADNPTLGYYGGAVPNPALVYNPSSGVAVLITEAGPASWAATSSHVLVPGRLCAIFFGAVGAIPAPATQEGQVQCN